MSAEVEAIRARYPVGATVELVRCTDEFTLLEPGARGRVVIVDDLGTIHVAWQGGARLGLVLAAGDECRVVNP